MDSSFVNYDGRSVHDMIEALLAMSGDPEAIRRLQESINSVDQRAQSSIAVVNAAIEQLETDKQDVGNYITDNVDNTVANISKAMIGNVDSGYDIQINGVGEGQVDVDWLRFIFKGRTAKQIAATIRRNGTWETAARWTADEDTGWEFLPNDYLTYLSYRKKNGIVFLTVSGPSKLAISTSQARSFATLPEGFRPDITYYFYFENRLGDTVQLQINSSSGNLDLVAVGSEVPAGRPVQGTISFPV